MSSDLLVWDASSFLTHKFEAPPFVIEPLLPSSGIGLLYGKRSVGKSQLALTMIRSMLRREPWLNRYPTQADRVCYVSVDMPSQMLQERLFMAFQGEALEGRFQLVIAETPVDVTLEVSNAGWAREVREFGPDIVFVDTTRKVHRLDENLATTPITVYSAFRRLLGTSPALLFLHHDKKDPPEGFSRGDETFRGSGAWMDDSDLGIRFTGLAAAGVGTVSFPRVRFSEDQPNIVTRMNPETLLWEPTSPSLDKLLETARAIMAAKPETSPAALREALTRVGGDPGDVDRAVRGVMVLENARAVIKV